MKLQEVKNVSAQRIRITQVRGFALNPGQSTKVHPATVKHPAVARYLPPKGRGLELVPHDSVEQKAEPIAPDPSLTPEVPVTPAPAEPTAGGQDNQDVAPEVTEVSEPGEGPEETPVEETPEASAETTEEKTPEVPEATVEAAAGKTLRETLIDADGINEDNVESVLNAFDSLEAIANASKKDLQNAGVAASYVKRVKAWAANA